MGSATAKVPAAVSRDPPDYDLPRPAHHVGGAAQDGVDAFDAGAVGLEQLVRLAQGGSGGSWARVVLLVESRPSPGRRQRP